MNRDKLFWPVLFLTMALVATISWKMAMVSYHEQARLKTRQAAQSQTSTFNKAGLTKIQQMVSLLATHPQVIKAVKGETLPDNETLMEELVFSKQMTGAALSYLLDREGTVIACTPYGKHGEKSLTGNNYSFRPYFIRAMKTGKPTTYVALGVTTGKRGIYHSAPIVFDNEIFEF